MSTCRSGRMVSYTGVEPLHSHAQQSAIRASNGLLAANLPLLPRQNGEVRTCVMPEILMNSLKSLAMNCGPLSEMIRGRASGYFSFAPCKMISMSASVIVSLISQFTMYRLKPSRMLHR
jgi:hypothetical protein